MTMPSANDNASKLTGSLARVPFFVDALSDALDEARNASERHPDDGGASNFDGCAVYLRKSAAFEFACKLLCLPFYRTRSGAYVVTPPTSAQGARRTAMARAMSSTLSCCLYNLKASVEYVTDLAGRIQPAPERKPGA
jgi:hypothetical protein